LGSEKPAEHAKIVLNIYHAMIAARPPDNRMLWRKLYKAGHIDEGKYHHFRERHSNENFDPEEIFEAW
jgi:hypothetical protein